MSGATRITECIPELVPPGRPRLQVYPNQTVAEIRR